MKLALRVLLGLALAPVCALLAVAALTSLPAALIDVDHPSDSTRYFDRDGALLREVRADDAMRARWISLEEVGDAAATAVLAAEDRRFYAHLGVDPIAVARAAFSDAAHLRIVSGASTLTMQLARMVKPHRRNALGKFMEMALALRIEASLSKREILESYLNRAPFGEGLRGIGAASGYYFDKPPKELSLAEAAALAAIPRGPAVYAMRAHPERVVRRRDRILDRMRDAGYATPEEVTRAKAEPLVVRAAKGSFGAPQFIVALREGAFGDAPTGRDVTTTVSRDLQREAELLVQATLRPLASRHVSDASVVVLDNESGEILAYVGSPDFNDEAHGGQNDGVRAKRQPGSTLKPFVYALAMERRPGFTPATILPDLQVELPVAAGMYAPMNYDERFHGPVRMREALASSLNVPAVWTLNQVGVSQFLDELHRLGFESLREDADAYGPALALGDGEVTLLELTNAYATLARGGLWRPVRAIRGAVDAARGAQRVMPNDVASAITDILSDRRARLASFGERSALDLPFEVAAKTGTSKGFRDNWTVGYTREVTVGVWVGNFDGSAMQGVSGITGAGPLFQGVMEAAMRGRVSGPLDHPTESDGWVHVAICPLSGKRPGPGCTHEAEEWMPRGEASHLASCDMHVRVAVDTRNGLRAGVNCPTPFIAQRVFERYDSAYGAWAKGARRDVAPEDFSPLCPASPHSRADIAEDAAALRIGSPRDGARLAIDPDRSSASQALAVRVLAPLGTEHVVVRVDGRVVANVRAPFIADWELTAGSHVLVAEADGRASDAVHVVVE